MPVRIYLGKDLANHLQEFKFSHEVDGFKKIAVHLWNKCAHQKREIALVANLRKTGAQREITPDVVVISELGIGVLELKHYFGEINCSDPQGAWYAGPVKIKPYRSASSLFNEEDPGYANPHQQIQDYAAQLRADLIEHELHAWAAGRLPPGESLSIHTAVCFTNPAAILTNCRQSLQSSYFPPEIVKPWEHFAILTPAEVPEWTQSLRFEVDLGPAAWYRPIELLPGDVTRLAQEFFGGVLWTEMIDQMYQRRAPYGYLAEVENDKEVQHFPLDEDDLVIGREAAVCNLTVQQMYVQVSRKHARLIHTQEGVFIEDLESQNGTYLDGKRVIGRRLLHSPAQVITLGGPIPAKAVCQLRYVTKISPSTGTVIGSFKP